MIGLKDRELSLALSELNSARRRNEEFYNYAEDDDLIESLIYERKALDKRYAFLLKEAKRIRSAE